MDWLGDFETHLTVAASSHFEVDGLREWTSPRGLKFTHIVLSRGSSASQPMVTRFGRGSLRGELSAAREVASELERAGFRVSRVKVEAAPSNPGVPGTDAEAAGRPADQYFEHHLKLMVGGDEDERRLAAVAGRHGAHLSRNARRLRPDGVCERFVTQRCAAVGRVTAARALASLEAELAALGHRPIETEAEYVVYDSNLSLDAGWIAPQEARS